ncbi:Aspartate aminotransferase, cytoplasmic 2 [Colletotrichum chlorophyti]|uniref:Aspartate aminotransferase n=1 Tax=Colletotrichum chlorophyti TaxID=708187 RepID=A0A1Q8S4F6_9PEZI|nr:Aspartate aminotransferase, cytoplasmic 2 [Colletotrichum chlorophyti]
MGSVPETTDGNSRDDPHEYKVNLGIGAYRDDEGRTWVLNSVKEAKEQMAMGDWSHEYLPLHGNDCLLEASRKILFGQRLYDLISDWSASIQTISGTGANSLIARFAGKFLGPCNIWLPDPSWDNHVRLWNHNAPNITQRRYPYYNSADRSFDFDAFMVTMTQQAAKGDIVLLHACAHNPTGLDPNQEQWTQIASLCQEKKLFVVFDVAYQGFASGDIQQDAWSVRHFLSRPDLEVAVCQSFSKNLGLYGERVGVLHIIPSRTYSTSAASAVMGQLFEIQRGTVSMGPRFGAEVASRVLSDDCLFQLWIKDLAVMSGRIKRM